MLTRKPRFASSLGLRLALACCILLLVADGLILAQSYTVAPHASQSLTTYLRQHRLPLVGAQVLKDGGGNRRIVLYGFVATELGRNDAARMAVEYVENRGRTEAPAPTLENRIEVRPEIARLKAPVAAPALDTGQESLDQVLNHIDRYGVTMVPAGPALK